MINRPPTYHKILFTIIKIDRNKNDISLIITCNHEKYHTQALIFAKNTILVPTFWGHTVTVYLVFTINLLTKKGYVTNELHSWHT